MARNYATVNTSAITLIDSSLSNLLTFTCSGWFWISRNDFFTANDEHYFFYKSSSATANEMFYLSYRIDSSTSNRTFKISMNTGSFTLDTVENDIPIKSWFHLVFSHGSGGAKIYLDGEIIGQTTSSLAAYTTTDSDTNGLIIGNGDSPNRGIEGKAAEIGIWNRVLSDAEIRLLSKRRQTPSTISSGLLSAPRLVAVDTSTEGSDQADADASGNNVVARHVFETTGTARTMLAGGHVPNIVYSTTSTSGFHDSVQGVWTFNQTREDQVGNNDFTSPDNNSANYVRFRRFDLLTGKLEGKYGLKFENNVRWTAGSDPIFVDTDGRYGVSIGFWWFSPHALGFVRHIETRKATPKIAPLIAKADSSISGGEETITVGEWVISEIAVSEKQNAIRAILFESPGNVPTHVLQSEAYDPGLHHIYFVYHGAVNSTARIDIDGKLGIQFDGPSGSNIIANSVGAIRLNDIGYGPTAHKETQDNGYINDLIIRNGVSDRIDDSAVMMKFGWDFLSQEELFFERFNFLGVGYTQPSTVDTTEVKTEGGDLIVTKSNGALLKGQRPLWDVKHNFTDKSILSVIEASDGDKVSIVNDELILEGTSIKIP